jgi:hypothetical protein
MRFACAANVVTAAIVLVIADSLQTHLTQVRRMWTDFVVLGEVHPAFGQFQRKLTEWLLSRKEIWMQSLKVMPEPCISILWSTIMIRGVDMPKASPQAVAQAVLLGIEAGEEDFFPDPMAQSAHAIWLQNPKALERQFGAM